MPDENTSNAVVVTSENLAAFNAEKIGLAPEIQVEVAEEAEPADIIEGELADPEEEIKDEGEKVKKPIPKIEKRFSELTNRAKVAEAKAQEERDVRIALETRLKVLEEGKTPGKVIEPAKTGEPDPKDFTDAFDYAKALAKYSTEEALKKRDQQDIEKRQTEERQKIVDSWKSRQAATEQELPDYQEIIAAATVVVSDEIRDAIVESEVGPKILYHLASHPEEAERIAKLPVRSALKELGKIEAKFEASTETKESTVKVRASTAPAPINPIKAKAAPDNKIGSDGEFHGSFDEYKQMRLNKKIK